MKDKNSILNKNIFLAISALIVIFIFDTFTPRGHLDWVLYIILLLYLSIRINKTQIIIIGVASIVFLFLGFFLSPEGIKYSFALYNRFVGVVVLSIIIWVAMRLKSDNEKILETLKEKETLIKETHHRIKNNLQLIISLLNLQTLQTDDKQIHFHLNESKNRIKSISLIHEKLHSSKSLSDVNIKEYLTELIQELVKTYNTYSVKIDLNLEIESLEINSKTAISIGLIVNELCTNSLKYAFVNRTDGIISLCLKNEKRELRKLVYSDNGVGLPKDFDFSQTNTLGMQLLRSFVGQINGRMKINQQNGLEYVFTFPGNTEIDYE